MPSGQTDFSGTVQQQQARLPDDPPFFVFLRCAWRAVETDSWNSLTLLRLGEEAIISANG